jgi:tetratricopeptide (TPR) repeat protein
MKPLPRAHRVLHWLDESLLLTNPVLSAYRIARWLGYIDWCSDQQRLCSVLADWERKGVFLPPEAVQDLISGRLLPPEGIRFGRLPEPRVVGLMVDYSEESGPIGLVTPITARVANEWATSPFLPFTGDQIQDAFARLLSGAELGEGVIPERLAFYIHGHLERKAFGPSMTIAGLLAVLDAASGHSSPCLRCACVVVQPDRDSDGLNAVEGIRPKLLGFYREYMRGSLLVRAPECPQAGEFDRFFDEVWRVANYRELCRRADDADLLRPFLRRAILTSGDVDVANRRLWTLIRRRERSPDALNLARRLLQSGLSEHTIPQVRRDISRALGMLYTHLGRFDDALKCLTEITANLARDAEFTCYEEQARAANQVAAALFTAHRFDDICIELAPWQERFQRDQRIVSPQLRALLLSTLARAYSVLNKEGWERLFSESLQLLEHSDVTEIPRTRNYLLHGLLRHQRLDEAQALVESVGDVDQLDPLSRLFFHFYQADLARRRKMRWMASLMEEQSEDTSLPRHPVAFYFQATARQEGCDRSEAARRFSRAGRLLRREVFGASGSNILVFLANIMDLAQAGWMQDPQQWQEATQALHGYLATPGTEALSKYYDGFLPCIESAPSVTVAERLLDRVPYL